MKYSFPVALTGLEFSSDKAFHFDLSPLTKELEVEVEGLGTKFEGTFKIDPDDPRTQSLAAWFLREYNKEVGTKYRSAYPLIITIETVE